MFLSCSRFRSKLRTLGFVTATALCLSAAPVLANPTGPQVRAGEVRVIPGLETQIQQLTDRAIIDWQSFSVAPHEAVRFLQPSELAVILNRVVGGDPSAILGRMEANGNVFLINPNGILFGPGSIVNVGGFVASTLNISNEDFLAGQYNFFQESGKDLASVVNQGTITITDGGYAVLTGPAVINEGTIIARAGKVALLAGERSTLNLDGRDLIHYTLGAEVSEGTILLAPGTMSEALASTLGVPVQNRASQLVRLEDGSICLVNSSGTLVQGGVVDVEGKAGLDAGTVTLDSADHTLLTTDSLTTASGVGHDSDGGDIFVLSEMNGVVFDRGFSEVQSGAQLIARGGESGDAGFIEVSGDRLQMQAEIDLSAGQGKAGLFLLDPVTTRVINGGNVGPVTDGVTGETIVTDGFLEARAANFALASTGDLIFDLTGLDLDINFQNFDFEFTAGTDPLAVGNIDLGQTNLFEAQNLTLEADGLIDLGTGIIGLDGIPGADEGHLLIEGGAVDLAGSVLNIIDGHLSIISASDVDFGTSQVNVDPSGGADLNSPQLSVQAQTGIDFSGSVVGVAATGDLRAVTSNGDITTNGGQIVVGAAGAGSISLEAPNGTISLGGSSLLAAENELNLVANQILLAAVDINVQTELHLTSDTTINFGNATIELGGLGPGLDQMTTTAAGDIFLEESLLEVFGQGNVRFESSGGAIDLGTVAISGPSVTNVDILSFVANGDLEGGEINIDFLGDIEMTSQEGSISIDGGSGPANLATDGNATLTALENINLIGDVFIVAGRAGAFNEGKASLTAEGRQAFDINGPVVDILGQQVVNPNTGSISLGNANIQASQIAMTVANELQGDSVNLLATSNETGDDIDIFVKQNVSFDSLSLQSPGQIRMVADENKPETNTGTMTFDLLLVGDGAGNRASRFNLRAGNELTISSGEIKANEVLLDNDFKSPIPTVIDGNTFFFASSTQATYGEQGGTNPDLVIEAGNLTMTNGLLQTFDTTISVNGNTFMDAIVMEIGENSTLNTGGTTELQGFDLKTDFNSLITSDSLITTFEEMVLSGAMEFNDDARLQADQKLVFDGGYILVPELDIALGDFEDTSDPDTGSSLVFRNAAGLNGVRPTDVILTDDLDIFGTDGGFRGTPNPAQAALGNVTVQVGVFDDLDLSIHAAGDVVVLDQTANVLPAAPLDHDLVVERLGEEGPGFSTSLAGIISTDGNISITTPANLVIGKNDPARLATDGETSMVLAESDTARIFVDALTIRDANDSTTGSVVDFDSGGFVEFFVRDSAGGPLIGENIQIDAPEILIDADNQNGTFVSIEVMPDNEFLHLLTQQSTQLLALDSSTGQSLRLTPSTTPILETLLPGTALSLANVHLVHQGNLEIGDLFFDGNLALEAQNGGSLLGSSSTVGTSGAPGGSLILLADGSIGTAARSLQVRSTTVTGNAQEIFLDSTGELTIGTAQVTDSLGTVRVDSSGLSAPGTLEVLVSGSGDLVVDRNLASNTGLALVTSDGDLRQGALGTINSPITALQVNGNAGHFTSNLDNSEITLNTNELVLDVEGDALVRKNSGDLELINNATIGGVNYQATGAGEDLRVRVDNGDLLLSTDLVIGQNAALVSGLDLGVTAQTLAPFVTLNGNLSVGQNLVIRSAGDIVHIDGQLTAPQMGLAAGGSVGTASNPLLINAGSLVTSGNGIHVNDSDGFLTVNQVQAVGVGVQNQTTGPPTTPPTTPPVTPPTAPPTNPTESPSIVVEVTLSNQEQTFSIDENFAQDRWDLVERDLKSLDDSDDAQDLALPLPVWMEDDFLRKRKFRR